MAAAPQLQHLVPRSAGIMHQACPNSNRGDPQPAATTQMLALMGSNSGSLLKCEHPLCGAGHSMLLEQAAAMGSHSRQQQLQRLGGAESTSSYTVDVRCTTWWCLLLAHKSGWSVKERMPATAPSLRRGWLGRGGLQVSGMQACKLL
jgi:hypothetical protein